MKNTSTIGLRKAVISFSGPIALELMLMSLLTIVNLSMVGNLGSYALGAVGLTSQPTFISLAFFQSLNIGSTALISRYIGAGEADKAKVVAVQTLLLAVILGAALAIICFIFSKQLVLMMGAKEDTLQWATMYMKYMSAGMVFQSVSTAVTSIMRGAGESKIPMRFNIISNLVNAGVGYILIYGLWSIPGFGLRGAAIATTFAKFTACLMAVISICKCSFPVAISFKDNFRLDPTVIKSILNIGVSAAGEALAMRVGFLLYTRIIADLGTAALAAHQIILSITGFGSNFVSGLAVAASSFTGRTLGAGKQRLAEKYCYEICKLGLVVSVLAGMAYFFGGYCISGMFSSEQAVLIISANVLKIAAFITIPQNYLMIISGSLRGAGDTRWPLVSALTGTIIARVGLAFILVKGLGFGLGGAWMAAFFDQLIRAILVFFRYRSRKWIQA